MVKCKGAPGAVGPYSQGVAQDGWLWTSGQVALDPETGQMVGDDAACAVRVISREASLKAARMAFAQAEARRMARQGTPNAGKPARVTAVHKIGVLKLTDGLFLDCAEEVAKNYPEIELETANIDACAMELVREPAHFDVILATNAFGDILSDIAAGLSAVMNNVGALALLMPAAIRSAANAKRPPAAILMPLSFA